MSSGQSITCYNEMPQDIDPPTFVIVDRASLAPPVTLTAGAGGSVTHDVPDDGGPWEVSVYMSEDRANRTGTVTATTTLYSAPADLKVETVYGSVSFDFRNGLPDARMRTDKPARPAASVLDQDANWSPIGDSDNEALGADLQFDMEKQQHSKWCWAAVTASVARYYGQNQYTQCKLATWRFGGKACDCCAEPFQEGDCNKTSSTKDALAHVGNLASGTDDSLSWEQVKHEIDAGRPVGVAVKWNSTGSRHAVVITGYNDDKEITVRDPGKVAMSVLPFDEFPAKYRSGASWAATFKTKRN